MAEHIYSISESFPDGQINLDNFIEEINNSEITAIFQYCNVDNGNCYIYFENELNSADTTLLNNLVTNHDNCEYDLGISLYAEDITTIDYNYLGLHKKETIDNLGFLIDVDMYRVREENDELTGLAINDHYEYTVNEMDLTSYRTETITWYKTNGSVYAQKSWEKYYNLNDAIKEGIRRRNNIIEKGKVYLMNTIQGVHDVPGEPVMPNAYYFYTLCASQINLYIAGMKDYLVDFFQNTNEPYITEEIRSGVLSIVKYWE